MQIMTQIDLVSELKIQIFLLGLVSIFKIYLFNFSYINSYIYIY